MKTIALISALFLSQAASASGTIHGNKVGSPVPYKYLDFSRALHYDYDIMMTNIENMTPRGKLAEPKTVVLTKSGPPPEPGSPGKLILLVLAALGASVGILTYANRRKITLT